jgi:hypothetical protein
MIGRDIVTRARVALNDPSGVRWPDAEFVPLINDACLYVVMQRPDAAIVSAPFNCQAGTRQTLADLNPDPLRLLDVERNEDGGRAIRHVAREDLDVSDPDWHSFGPTTRVTNYVFDNRDPLAFYLYPPPRAAHRVRVLYVRDPVRLTSTGELDTVVLTPPDVFIDPTLNYVLFRCYAKDSDDTHNASLAALYRGACDSALGIKTATDARFSPSMNSGNTRPAAGTMAGGV